MSTRETDREAQDNLVDLSEHSPELIARAIMFAYFEKYPISPDVEVMPNSKTVSQVMAENSTSASSFSRVPTEPKFDPLLHLQMFLLGGKIEMKYLQEYAMKKFKKSLAMDGEAFWPCIEILNGIDEEVANKVERKLRHAAEGKVWKTKRPFSDLEKLRPNMAAKISEMGRRRFGMP
jgi:hypothetical protein